MSHVEVKIVVAAAHLASLGEFLQSIGTATGVAGTTVDTAESNVKVTPAVEEPKAPPARRTRNAPAKAADTVAEEPEVEKLPADFYDTKVKPVLVKLSGHANGGREEAIKLVTSFNVKNAKDIPSDKLEDALKKAKEALAKLEAAAPAESDDVSFE